MAPKVQELLREIADEVPPRRGIPPRTLREARRRVGLTIVLAVGLVAAIGGGAFAGIHQLISAGPERPGHRSPLPSHPGPGTVSFPTAPSPGTLLGPGFVPSSMAFFDPRHGLVAGGIGEGASPEPGPVAFPGLVGATADGGRTWKVTLRTDWALDDVTTFGDRFAWTTLGGCGSGTRCSQPVVFASEDAGLTWSAVSHDNLARLSFVSPKDGWAIRTQSNAAPAPLAVTSDGGATWTDAGNPCPHGTLLQDVRFASRSQGWVLCTGEPGAGNQFKAVLESSDGGRTWHETSGVLFRLGKRVTMGTGLPSSGYALGIFFLANGHGWLWMSREYSYVTEDGGRSWRPMKAVSAPEVRYPLSIWFTAPPEGLVLLWDGERNAYSLLRTSNGGASWQRVF